MLVVCCDLLAFQGKAAPFVLHNGFLKEHGKTLHEQIHRLKEPDNLATTHLGAIRDWLLTMFLLKKSSCQNTPKLAAKCPPAEKARDNDFSLDQRATVNDFGESIERSQQALAMLMGTHGA